MKGLLAVLVSHPRWCPVCGSGGDVELVPLSTPAAEPARIRCPHCGPLRLPLVLTPDTNDKDTA